MTGTAERRVCPLCGGRQLQPVVDLPAVPIHSMVLLETPEEARRFPRGRLRLMFCSACGFLFNAAFEPERMAYDGRFEESQHFSPTFGRFAEGLVERLAESLGPDNHVVEVGCGRGEVLAALCRRAGCRGTGVDPGWRPGRLPEPLPEKLSFRAESLGPQHANLGADLLLCRHTLEHVSDVRYFLELAVATTGNKPRSRLLFETPDAGRILSEGAFWDLYYEHCSYFTVQSKRALFSDLGLEVTRLEQVFGAQYLLLEARHHETSPRSPSRPSSERTPTETSRFAEQRDRWRKAVREKSASGERLVLWGGGSKAVSFLTTLGLGDEVLAVVDINPYRQGRYLPGSGHPIVGPDALPTLRPDRVIVMNPLYLDEISASLDSLGLAPVLEALG